MLNLIINLDVLLLFFLLFKQDPNVKITIHDVEQDSNIGGMVGIGFYSIKFERLNSTELLTRS